MLRERLVFEDSFSLCAAKTKNHDSHSVSDLSVCERERFLAIPCLCVCHSHSLTHSLSVSDLHGHGLGSLSPSVEAGAGPVFFYTSIICPSVHPLSPGAVIVMVLWLSGHSSPQHVMGVMAVMGPGP